MARRLRELVAGGIYHVFARGNNRGRIFADDRDREKYLAMLGEVIDRKEWRCLQFCLMDNHAHFLIETPKPNLDTGMQLFHGRYGRWFNDEHKRSGHVFQGRYGAIRIEFDGQLLATAAYIAANPVAAGLCARCEDWQWSSHRMAIIGERPGWLDVDRLLQHYALAGRDPLRHYVEWTDMAVDLAATAA